MPIATIQKSKKRKTSVRRSKSVTQYTYADYLRLPADERYEIINGKLRKMSPSPSIIHQKAVVSLLTLIANLLSPKIGECELFVAPMDVVLVLPGEEPLKSKNVVQPDIFVVCDKQKITENAIIGAPDFVIEIVSPSSLRFDRYDKFQLYEKYGVKEYWLVYPKEQMIESYVSKDGKFELSDVYSLENNPAKIQTFDIELDLTKVFPSN